MKKIRYAFEYAFLRLLHAICSILPWYRASQFLGQVAVTISPMMAMNRKSIRHIQAALQCDHDQAADISKGHWKNLGQVMGEFPHLKAISENHVTFKGFHHLESLRDDHQCGILFGAHLGNWEVIPHALLHHAQLAMHPVYRAPNNPYVDKRLHHYRSPDGQLVPYAKSRQGMVGMVKALRAGEHLGLLIDQKYNEGVDASFFGMKAKTGTAFIELAKKYDCPLVPIRCIRQDRQFIIDVHAPIVTKNRDAIDILKDAHTLLETWIKEHPEQWLWVHRRWKPEDLRE